MNVLNSIGDFIISVVGYIISSAFTDVSWLPEFLQPSLKKESNTPVSEKTDEGMSTSGLWAAIVLIGFLVLIGIGYIFKHGVS